MTIVDGLARCGRADEYGAFISATVGAVHWKPAGGIRGEDRRRDVSAGLGWETPRRGTLSDETGLVVDLVWAGAEFPFGNFLFGLCAMEIRGGAHRFIWSRGRWG